jgi:hypothetical protein
MTDRARDLLDMPHAGSVLDMSTTASASVRGSVRYRRGRGGGRSQRFPVWGATLVHQPTDADGCAKHFG